MPQTTLTELSDISQKIVLSQIVAIEAGEDRLSFDIRYGDVVVPAVKEAVMPSFLQLPAPRLKIYPV